MGGGASSLLTALSLATAVDTSRNDPALRGLKNAECRYFLAKSAIPNAGMGIYTATNIARKDDSQPMPDLCLAIPHQAQEDFASITSVAFQGTQQ